MVGYNSFTLPDSSGINSTLNQTGQGDNFPRVGEVIDEET